jgi:hypothetical protein
MRETSVALVFLLVVPGLAAPVHGGRRDTGVLAARDNCARPEQRLLTLEERLERRLARGLPVGRRAQRRIARLARRHADRCVDLNEIQVLGSHNSYHIQPREPLFGLLVAFSPEFLAWEYTHLPLDVQFETQGIRQIELDVFADPEGGLYARRRGAVALGIDPMTPPELHQPGFKVLHVQDLDFETTCPTFVACLQTIKAWSDANPRHLPIMVLVEAKDEVIPDPLDPSSSTSPSHSRSARRSSTCSTPRSVPFSRRSS